MRDEKGRFIKGGTIGEEYRFKKGNVPWDKGIKRPGFGFQPGHKAIGGFETRFKKGDGLGEHHSEVTKLKMSLAATRENNSNWNGGRKNNRGYVLILKPEHPFNIAGYVREHRLVMEDFLGRYLKEEEVVHHENEIRDDNKLENLRLFENDGKHTAYHHKKDRLALAI